MIGFIATAALIYGFGIAVVMYWIFHVITQYIPAKSMVKNLLQVVGAFVGSTAIVIATYKPLDLAMLTGATHADGVAILATLAGFGAGAAFLGLRTLPSTHRQIFSDFSKDLDLHVLLMRNEYNKSSQDVATFFNISVTAANRRYLAALRKIKT